MIMTPLSPPKLNANETELARQCSVVSNHANNGRTLSCGAALVLVKMKAKLPASPSLFCAWVTFSFKIIVNKI
jgi:hypothetical protein